MATEDTSIRTLEHTPSWALATVCFVFISVSIVLEHIFHRLTNVSTYSQEFNYFSQVNMYQAS